MVHINLFEDEDGIIWYDEQGESREVGSYSAYNYDEERMYTVTEVICESIAESTDEAEGAYSLYDDEGNLVRNGTFTQDRNGVEIESEGK